MTEPRVEIRDKDSLAKRHPFLASHTWIWYSDLTTNERAVLHVLWTFARADGSSCFPSVSTLADRTAISERTVQRVLRELEDRALVTRLDRKGESSMYLLHNVVTELAGGCHSVTGGCHSVTPTPVTVTPDVSQMMYSTDERPPAPVGGVVDLGGGLRTWEEVRLKWNDLAGRFGLQEVRGVLNDRRKKHYRARLRENPMWWVILEAGLPLRGSFYLDTNQPTFDQATRASYFDEKIRDGAWNAPKGESRPAGPKGMWLEDGSANPGWKPRPAEGMDPWPNRWQARSSYRKLALQRGIDGMDRYLESFPEATGSIWR